MTAQSRSFLFVVGPQSESAGRDPCMYVCTPAPAAPPISTAPRDGACPRSRVSPSSSSLTLGSHEVRREFPEAVVGRRRVEPFETYLLGRVFIVVS